MKRKSKYSIQATKALAATLELYKIIRNMEVDLCQYRKLRKLVKRYLHIEGQMNIADLDSVYHDLRREIHTLLDKRLRRKK